jgi:hypothetical protein
MSEERTGTPGAENAGASMQILNPETGEHVAVSTLAGASYSLHATMKGWALRRDGHTVSMFDTFFEAERAALLPVLARREAVPWRSTPRPLAAGSTLQPAGCLPSTRCR